MFISQSEIQALNFRRILAEVLRVKIILINDQLNVDVKQISIFNFFRNLKRIFLRKCVLLGTVNVVAR